MNNTTDYSAIALAARAQMDPLATTTPEQQTDAERYVRRTLGDDAGDVLEMLGLAS